MDRSTIFISLLICMYCLIHCCNGANYGESCSPSNDCTSSIYQICDSTTQKCVCVNNYTVNSNVDGCVAEVSLGAVCTNPTNSGVSSTEPCTDTNATCHKDGSTYSCRCTADYYDNNGDNVNGGQCILKKLLDENCPKGTKQVPNTITCSDTYARCKWYSGLNYKCQCMDGYYDNDGKSSTGGTCTLKVSLGVACPNPNTVSSTASCSDTNAECQQESSDNTYRCRCTAHYYDNNGYNNDRQCTLKLTCKECSTDTKAIIVGVVLGLIILLLIGYSGYITLRLRRGNLNPEQSKTSPNTNKQPTCVNQVFENVAMPGNSVEDYETPVSAYRSLNDETRAETSTYDWI